MGRSGTIKTTWHKINLVPVTKPSHRQPYRAGQQSWKVLKERISTQLEAGIIELTYLYWVSLFLLVLKKEKTLLFCANFWRINAVAMPDTFPLPRIEDCINCVREAKVFPTLTLYWDIGKGQSKSRINIKRPPAPTLIPTATNACPLDCATCRPRSKACWMLFSRQFADNLDWFILRMWSSSVEMIISTFGM